MALERDNKRYTATIVRVEPATGKDIALLHTTARLSRCVRAVRSAR